MNETKATGLGEKLRSGKLFEIVAIAALALVVLLIFVMSFQKEGETR